MSIHLLARLPSTSKVAQDMLLSPRRPTRHFSRLGITALLAIVCLLCPAAAGARGKAHRQASPGEESIAAPLQESTPTPPGATGPPSESGTKTPREERRARRSAQSAPLCSVELEATPSTLTAGVELSLNGTVSCPETGSAANQTVTLYQKLAHTHAFAIVATTTTEANGTFHFTPSAPQFNSDFYATAEGSASASTSVKVAPLVTLSAPAAGTQLFIGGAPTARASTVAASGVTFSGSVSPAAAGTTVTLQREFRREAWHRIGVGQVDSEGNYSIIHTFERPGEANIRVVLHAHGLDLTSASKPVRYQISRRRSKHVTIQASADPVAYGSSVTVSGTVAGALNQSVTLWAQTRGGAFAPVATTTASGNEYSFSESPLQSTRYRVSSAFARSAALLESVTYALTPEPFAFSAPAGEQLNFTGTLTPSHEGQAVDLEQQETAGLEYHVIAVGSVSSSAYSITHTFATAGSELLRISVPGTTEIQSVMSAPFGLAITPSV
jgi:hypothetical protein